MITEDRTPYVRSSACLFRHVSLSQRPSVTMFVQLGYYTGSPESASRRTDTEGVVSGILHSWGPGPAQRVFCGRAPCKFASR